MRMRIRLYIRKDKMSLKNMLLWMLSFIIIGFLIYQKDWTGIFIVFCFAAYLHLFNFIKSTKIKTRMIQLSFCSAMLLVFINIFLHSRILYSIYFMFLMSGVLMARALPRKKGDFKTLHNKIKQDLNIGFVKSYTRKFPKFLSFVGGFMSPMMPIFTFVNKKWKKKKTKEAIIHENVHIWLLLHKLRLIYLLIFIFFISAVAASIMDFSIFLGLCFQIFCLACALVYFEKETFDHANIIGRKYNIRTRRFNRRLAISYFIVYCMQFLIMVTIFLALYGLFEFIKLIIYFVIRNYPFYPIGGVIWY